MRLSEQERSFRRDLGWGVVIVLLLDLLVLLWATGCWAQAFPVPQQCVTNALAGGTSDAITTQALPCALTTNILLLTAAAANATTTPTLQPLGLTAQPIVRANGGALQVGDITGTGYLALLSPTGSEWKLLNPANAASGTSAGSVLFQPPGSPVPPPIDLQTRGLFQSFAGDFGASGSSQSTTVTTIASNPNVVVASAIDFQVGQGVLIQYGGGPTASGNPTFTVTPTGSTGSTHYCYDLQSVDGLGGLGPVVQHCITNGNATLSTQNYNLLTITQSGSAKGVVIWEAANSGGPFTYWGSSDTTSFRDTGFANPNKPVWITSTPVAQNDWFVASILSISGATLTLNAPVVAAETGVVIKHDDTAALNQGLNWNSAGGTMLLVPCGTYNLSGVLNFNSSNIGMVGYGTCTSFLPVGALNDFNLVSTPASPLVGDFLMNLSIVDTNKALGLGLIANSVNNFTLANVSWTNPYSGIQIKNFNNLNGLEDTVTGFFGQDGFVLALESDATH